MCFSFPKNIKKEFFVNTDYKYENTWNDQVGDAHKTTYKTHYFVNTLDETLEIISVSQEYLGADYVNTAKIMDDRFASDEAFVNYTKITEVTRISDHISIAFGEPFFQNLDEYRTNYETDFLPIFPYVRTSYNGPFPLIDYGQAPNFILVPMTQKLILTYPLSTHLT